MHRVLPTALSLSQMGVQYDSEDCHRCGRVDTIDHVLIECPAITVFHWNYVSLFIDKIAGQPLRLTPEIKLLGQLLNRATHGVKGS